MSEETQELNQHGNHEGEFSQGVGGWAEYTVWMTPTDDAIRHDVTVPPNKVIPIVFLPGVMGSNLRMAKTRQDELVRNDNMAWKADDIGSVDALTGSGYAGWFKKATPAQRQMNFDPEQTEVASYRYTEDKGRFDPGGAITRESDAQHGNVPNGMSAIPPLLTKAATPPSGASRTEQERLRETPAQKARWRGWSEVLFGGAYGELLQTLERQLNNMVKKGAVTSHWKERAPDDHADESNGAAAQRPVDWLKLVGKKPRDLGAEFEGDAITEDDLKKIAPCWYPVHAMGYNWLQSNSKSGIKVAERIKGLIKGYQDRGFKCEKVILVTHSMGGLVARAVLHPEHGNLHDSVLGVYHNVMPTLGAAGAYKRMRFGFQEKNGGLSGLTDTITARILGPDGASATAILANAQAPMEMLPGQAYGYKWLKVVYGSPQSSTFAAWPSEEQGENALSNIYLQPKDAWWRLINPDWVNPGKQKLIKDRAEAPWMDGVHDRLEAASEFLHSIEETFHPVTYASYCASPHRASYGEVKFLLADTVDRTRLPPANTWTLLSDDGKKLLTVQAGPHILTLTRQPADAAGDETVPSARSAERIRGKRFVHGLNNHGYEHQNSYLDPLVQASALYAIVQIAKTDKWEEL